MALSASTAPASERVVLCKSLPFHLYNAVIRKSLFSPNSAARSHLKLPRMELSSQPSNDPPKFNVQSDYATIKLHGVIPDVLQRFPWREAENVVTKRLVTLLQKTLKWSLAASLAIGFLSDIIYAISINRELFIPLGLLSGCPLAELVKEMSQELFHLSQKKDKTWHFLGMGSLFVLFRIIGVLVSAEPPAFLLHVANGGLMHVLWQWKNSSYNGDVRTNVTPKSPISGV